MSERNNKKRRSSKDASIPFSGKIEYRVGAIEGQVVIDFGIPVTYLGLTPERATAMALILMEKSRQASAQKRDDSTPDDSNDTATTDGTGAEA